MSAAGNCRSTANSTIAHYHPPRSYKRGYKNVISKGVELNAAGVECPLMMETSGHGAMKVGYAAFVRWFALFGRYIACTFLLQTSGNVGMEVGWIALQHAAISSWLRHRRTMIPSRHSDSTTEGL